MRTVCFVLFTALGSGPAEPGGASDRERRAAPSIGGLAATGSRATAVAASRPDVLDVALSPVARLAARARHRQARRVAHSAGPRGSRRLLRDALTVRMLLLGLALGLLNLYAGSVADLLELGPSGSTWLRLISAIAVARAAVDMMTRALNAFFAQKWSNIIALVQVILELSFVGIALALGYEMNGLLGGLLGAALAVALLSVGIVSWQFRHVELPVSADATEPDRARRWFSGEGRRVLPIQPVHLPFRILCLISPRLILPRLPSSSCCPRKTWPCLPRRSSWRSRQLVSSSQAFAVSIDRCSLASACDGTSISSEGPSWWSRRRSSSCYCPPALA